MLKRFGIGATVLAVATMAFAAIAPATHAEEPVQEDVALHGRGVLDARGDGLVAVKGKMDLYGRADGGILLVKDIAGDAVVRVNGDGKTASYQGFTVYFGFEGEARVTGSDVAVIIVGKDIRLHVLGAGWAYLKGEGTFEVNNFGPFPWSPDGRLAAIEAAAAE